MQRVRSDGASGRPARPRHVGDVLSELFALKGYARIQASAALEEHWRAAVGETVARHSRPWALRRGVLEVVVDNSALLQELASFERDRLLEELRCRLEGEPLKDLRFRVGPLS